MLYVNSMTSDNLRMFLQRLTAASLFPGKVLIHEHYSIFYGFVLTCSFFSVLFRHVGSFLQNQVSFKTFCLLTKKEKKRAMQTVELVTCTTR